MFFNLQTEEQQNEYLKFLSIIGGLSKLFSDSSVPYLYYRIAETVFCRAFSAEDLSRSDVSADAKKERVGIGLKTFRIGNSKTFQKIAEFNRDRKTYERLAPAKFIKRISELRNERIKFTERAHGIEKSIYHCVVRDEGRFILVEENMDLIDIDNIKGIKDKQGSISFNDGKNEYSFLKSKSTLTKRFLTDDSVREFGVDILKDPLSELQVIFKEKLELETEKKIVSTIFLPLYGHDKKVYEKSGLNQWNAGGRKRNLSEVYIPIPSVINKYFADFFPSRNTSFILKLPNGNEMDAKVCQENDKALMSYSNKELGEWILRDVLNLKEGEILTYKKLEELGVDSVRIDKVKDGKYEINFAAIDSFEQFIEQVNQR